jgi:hypothetical protein
LHFLFAGRDTKLTPVNSALLITFDSYRDQYALLAHGANLKAKGKDGKTALDLLRAEVTRCHTAPNYHAGMCDSTDAELARPANSPAH